MRWPLPCEATKDKRAASASSVARVCSTWLCSQFLPAQIGKHSDAKFESIDHAACATTAATSGGASSSRFLLKDKPGPGFKSGCAVTNGNFLGLFEVAWNHLAPPITNQFQLERAFTALHTGVKRKVWRSLCGPNAKFGSRAKSTRVDAKADRSAPLTRPTGTQSGERFSHPRKVPAHCGRLRCPARTSSPSPDAQPQDPALISWAVGCPLPPRCILACHVLTMIWRLSTACMPRKRCLPCRLIPGGAPRCSSSKEGR
jgi:hypothetical protein